MTNKELAEALIPAIQEIEAGNGWAEFVEASREAFAMAGLAIIGDYYSLHVEEI